MEIEPQGNSPSSLWHWLGLAFLAQLGWGAYPVLLRYLQTISGIPSLSLLAAGNIVVLLLVVPALYRRIDTAVFRLPVVWLFGSLVILRGLTNLMATRYTLAIYAQLIYLMTPYIVAFLSRILLGEQLPRNTIKALLISSTGAMTILLGNLNGASAAASASRNDPLGISLAVASSFFLALYMVITRRTASHKAPWQSLLVVHLVALALFSAAGSVVIGEDWGQWRHLTAVDWFVFGLFALGVLFGANLTQIRTIQQLGAPLVSSIMASRLVSALALAAILLGERLTSIYQAAGALLVIGTITWYLRQQHA